MGLFKEITCVHCGKKAGLLTRQKLVNGQYVCGKCAAKIPAAILNNLGEYTYDDFKELLDYLKESDGKLARVFRETHKFHSIHLDTQHELFYLDNMYPRVYLKLENLAEYSLQFDPDELKEGFLQDKVSGNIYYKARMDKPSFFMDTVLARDVKAHARVKPGVFKDTVEFDNPKGMDEFAHHFGAAWRHAVNEKLQRLVDY